MPDVSKYTDEKEWMGACVPKMMGEGKDNDQAVAACMSMWEHKSIDDTLVTFGDAIKALGDNKFGGYLVRFSTEADPDLTGDFFTAETDFDMDFPGASTVYFNHGLDNTIKRRKLGRAELSKDEAGIWAEFVLQERDDYEKKLAELAKAGKLGWSSGTASHLVERSPVGKSWKIDSWPLGKDASLTHTPAEPRNGVIALKSLLPKENNEMEKEEFVALLGDFKTELAKVAAESAEAAVKKYADETAKEIKAGYATHVEVTKDEADQPFKTAGEYLTAVKNAAIQPHDIDRRLLSLKATGLNEATPSQGGFLVQQDLQAGILQRMYGVGNLLSRFNPMTVSGNGMLINALDETSRANGSRLGGVLGYWLNEGGTKTASKPKFRQIDLKLKKVAALCYATDEILEDATALESWINTYVPDELRFMVEAAIMGGDGVGKPLGILNSPALVSARRTDASEIDATDIARMWARRWVGAQDYVWFAAPNIMPQLIQMTVGQMPVYMPPGGLSGSQYGTIYGKPLIETEYNPGLGTVGDLLLVSPSQYALIQKGGIQSASSIHVQFLTDETAFRFVYRVDGEPAWNSDLTPYNGTTDTVSPFVALAATT
jgi:HK97 family phage major capsid protein